MLDFEAIMRCMCLAYAKQRAFLSQVSRGAIGNMCFNRGLEVQWVNTPFIGKRDMWILWCPINQHPCYGQHTSTHEGSSIMTALVQVDEQELCYEVAVFRYRSAD